MDNKQAIILAYLILLDEDDIAFKKLYELTNEKLAQFLLEWREDCKYAGCPIYTKKMCKDVKWYIIEKYKIDKILDDIKDDKDINPCIDENLLNLKEKIDIIDNVIKEEWRGEIFFDWNVEVLRRLKIIESNKNLEELANIKMDMLNELWKEFENVKFGDSSVKTLQEDFMGFEVGETTQKDINKWFFYKGFKNLE